MGSVVGPNDDPVAPAHNCVCGARYYSEAAARRCCTGESGQR